MPPFALPTQRWWRLRSQPRPRSRTLAAALAAVVLLLLWWLQPVPEAWPREQILAAIRFVESSDRDDVPDGDGGKAIGPYQIHEVYWQDALRQQPMLGGRYADCRRRQYAEAVIAAYMQKWAPDAWARGDAERIARIHNGGPGGADKVATAAYWQRVRARLP
jgi:hypothetical protein